MSKNIKNKTKEIEMMNFIKDEKISDELFELIGHNGATAYATALTTTPINIILALDNITDEEKDIILNGNFEIGTSVVDDVPFLTFMFDRGLSFDTIIYSLESENAEENAMNLIIIDSNDYTFKGARTLGIYKGLLKTLIKNVKNISYHKDIEAIKQLSIYETFSTKDIHNMSLVKQCFK